MSFYRTFIAAVAAFGLATSAFAADQASTQNPAGAAKTQATTAAPEAAAPVNINTATADDLAKVRGLNKAKATKIVKYRDANGNFTSVEDLKKVKGLGLNAKQIKKIQGQLTVG